MCSLGEEEHGAWIMRMCDQHSLNGMRETGFCKSTKSIFGTNLFSAIFGLAMFSRNFVLQGSV